MVESGEISQAKFDQWEDETGSKRLPERITKKKRRRRSRPRRRAKRKDIGRSMKGGLPSRR